MYETEKLQPRAVDGAHEVDEAPSASTTVPRPRCSRLDVIMSVGGKHEYDDYRRRFRGGVGLRTDLRDRLALH
eukprot:1704063-Heterocapsa_arctica.AAC.1